MIQWWRIKSQVVHTHATSQTCGVFGNRVTIVSMRCTVLHAASSEAGAAGATARPMS